METALCETGPATPRLISAILCQFVHALDRNTDQFSILECMFGVVLKYLRTILCLVFLDGFKIGLPPPFPPKKKFHESKATAPQGLVQVLFQHGQRCQCQFGINSVSCLTNRVPQLQI